MHNTRTSGRRGYGFTLTEVVLALGVFAFVIVSNYALFGLSITEIRRVADRDAAIRATGALQDGLRKKSWAAFFDSISQQTPWLVYNYRASLTSVRADGSPTPFTGSGIAGRDFKITAGVRVANDPLLASDLAAREANLFFARIQLSSANPITSVPSDISTYLAGVLAYKCEIFDIPSAASIPPAGAKPLYSTTLSYLR